MTTREATIERVLPDIFYEEPERIEDDMQQEPTISLLTFMLRWRFSRRADVFIGAGGFVFWNPDNGNDRVGPDCFITIGTDPDFVYQFPNYFVWEVGKPPDLVLEVASPSTASNDLGHKRDLYARLGVTEYWKMDPTGGELYGVALMGERLVDGEYVAYDLNVEPDGTVWSRSEVLNLGFRWDGERFSIRDPLTGETIDPRISLESERTRAEAAEIRANAAERRAEEERARAERERQTRLELEARVQRLTEERGEE